MPDVVMGGREGRKKRSPNLDDSKQAVENFNASLLIC
jgi:hypothetical protein